jgi:hypothetical protein
MGTEVIVGTHLGKNEIRQQGPDDNVGPHCCSKITADDISETMTYVMWREERLWNVNVLERVHTFPI